MLSFATPLRAPPLFDKTDPRLQKNHKINFCCNVFTHLTHSCRASHRGAAACSVAPLSGALQVFGAPKLERRGSAREEAHLSARGTFQKTSSLSKGLLVRARYLRRAAQCSIASSSLARWVSSPLSPWAGARKEGRNGTDPNRRAAEKATG
jgi:hypothetical protein